MTSQLGPAPRNAGPFVLGCLGYRLNLRAMNCEAIEVHPAGPAAISQRPEPIVIVSALSLLIEPAYVKVPF